MLGLQLSSFSDIKEELEKYLAERQDLYGVVDTQRGSAKTMIVDMVSGFLAFLNYKYVRYREESYLSSARLRTSVYNLARHFGYRINRGFAPEFMIEYTGNEVLNLVSGMSIGQLEDKVRNIGVVYFGNEKRISRGYKFKVSLANWRKVTGNFLSYDFNETIIMNLPISDTQAFVDDRLIKLDLNGVRHELSKAIEEFIVKRAIVDITNIENSAEIWFYNRDYDYGFPITKETEYKIEYLEAYGRRDSIWDDYESNKLKLDDGFILNDVIEWGENGDTLQKIREIAPLYYTTFRRMVTKCDHEIISKAYPGILDVHVWKDDCHCCQTNICYLRNGSGIVPNEFTVEEEDEFYKYLDQFRLVGNKIKVETAQPVHIHLWFQVRYDCSVRNSREEATIVDSFLLDELGKVISQYEGKLGHKFNISNIIVGFGRIKYNNIKLVAKVFAKLIKDGEVIDITEEDNFECDSCEYFSISRDFELRCITDE